MRIDWLNIAQKCFTAADRVEMHVNDLAAIAVQQQIVTGQDVQAIAHKFSSALSVNVKRKGSLFTKVRNKTGGLKRGVYKLKRVAATKLIRVNAPMVETGYTGKAGEHAVFSELLFRGYNASIMAVDHGIDLVASKNNKYFHLQVKTANGDDSRPYTTSIRREAFQHSSDTFYIIVLRRALKQRYVNDYLILPSSEIRRNIQSGVLKEGSTISLRIVVDGKGKFLLNGATEVTHCINDFDSIC
jgi:hypothetical protein